MLPKEIGDLSRLKELHIQSNRLTVLPPELGLITVSLRSMYNSLDASLVGHLCSNNTIKFRAKKFHWHRRRFTVNCGKEDENK